ncbi:MAG TPA: hypothetical protein VLG37_01750 [Candidatus Saccharimonadales bacterium]|nr:hypothetical protein [Candidatus Saccharimonadales bacterium]
MEKANDQHGQVIHEAEKPDVLFPAAELAAELATDIRQGGDALHRLRWLRKSPLGGGAALTLAAVVGAIEGFHLNCPLSLKAAYVTYGAIACLGAAEATATEQRKSVDSVLHRQNTLGRVLETAPIEVYRRGQDLLIRWYGQGKLDKNTLGEELAKLRVAAEAAKATTILLPLKTVVRYLPRSGLGEVTTQDDWLSQARYLGVKDKTHGQEKLLLLSRTELEELVASIGTLEKITDPVEYVLGLIRERVPEHPALHWGRVWNRDDQVTVQKLRTAFRRCLEKDLQEVTRERRAGPDLPAGQRSYHNGNLRVDELNGPQIDWLQSSRRIDRTESLLTYYGYDTESLESVLLAPGNYSDRQVIQACELAGWLILNGWKGDKFMADLALDPVKQRQDLASTAETLQARLADAILLDNVWQEPVAKLVKSRRKPTNKNLDLSTLRKRRAMLSLGLGGAMLLGSYGASFGIYEAIKPHLKSRQEAQKDAPQDLFDPLVGNVAADRPNTPVWNITSIHGLSAEGYWASRSYHIVDGKAMFWREPSQSESNQELVQEIDSKEGPYAYEDLAQPSLLRAETPKDNFMPMLQVHSATGLAAAAEVYAGLKGVDHLVRVPVLQGTEIRAAEVNGQPTKLITDPDGHTAIAFKGSSNQELSVEYWLYPTEPTAGLRAVEPIKVRQNGLTTLNPNELSDVWRHQRVTVAPDSRQRLETEKNYIKTRFDYDLAPLQNADVLNDRQSYANYVLKHKKANCNVANSLLAISNPQELNYVTGFQNGGDSPQVLSARERHGWTVDKGGLIYDATPIATKQSNGPDISNLIGLGVLGLIVGVAGFKEREVIAKAVKAGGAVAYIKMRPARQLAEVRQVIEQTRWTPDSAALKLRRAKHRKDYRAQRDKSLEAIYEYAVNDPAATDSISRRRSAINDFRVKRAARRAQRLIQAARLIA